jgi:predicted DNA-binding transcriptional regulator YafY
MDALGKNSYVPYFSLSMPRGNQLARQWQLLQLIDQPAGIAVDDAARKLDCTVRTIWRDLSTLQKAGFPLYDDKGADGRRSLWKLEEQFTLGLPVKLSLAETAALVMSRDLLRPAGAGVLGAVVTSAFDKIGRVLSRDALRLLDQMRESIGVRAVGAKLQAPAAEHVALIQKALLERRRLDMRYYSMSRDEENRRQVDPYHLTLFDGGFYMVGYCHWRKTERIFAVERIRDLKILAATFKVPARFYAQEYLQHTWGIVKGEVVPVKVIFSRSVARYIRDRLWHPSQKFSDLSDGRLEMTLRVADTLEVRRWILGYGPDAEVIEPPALQRSIRFQAEALIAHLAPGPKNLARIVSQGSYQNLRATQQAAARSVKQSGWRSKAQ